MKQYDYSDGTIKHYTKEKAQKEVIEKFDTSRASNGIAYSTNYGVGVWFIFMPKHWIDGTKKAIETKLSDLNIQFCNEFSEAGWVFRYVFNGSYLDHNKIIESL